MPYVVQKKAESQKSKSLKVESLLIGVIGLRRHSMVIRLPFSSHSVVIRWSDKLNSTYMFLCVLCGSKKSLKVKSRLG